MKTDVKIFHSILNGLFMCYVACECVAFHILREPSLSEKFHFQIILNMQTLARKYSVRLINFDSILDIQTCSKAAKRLHHILNAYMYCVILVPRLSQFIWQFIKNTLVTPTPRIEFVHHIGILHTPTHTTPTAHISLLFTFFLVTSSHLLPTHKMVLENYYHCYCWCEPKSVDIMFFERICFNAILLSAWTRVLESIWKRGMRGWGKMEQKCTVKLQLTFDSVESFRWIQQLDEMAVAEWWCILTMALP